MALVTTVPLPPADLEFIAMHDPSLWQDLQGARIFLTGGTGFYGAWLVESFCAVQDIYQLTATLTVLTRDPVNFKQRFPHLAARTDLYYVTGDVRDFKFPEGSFTHLIHAATPASATMNLDDPINMFTTIVDGTKRVLEFARKSGVEKFLLTSSGAVYGPQPADVTHMKEDFFGGPDQLAKYSAYGEGKRAAECMSSMYGRIYGFDVKIARGFAFVGPHLPMDGTYAIGNFIANALKGQPIDVSGDGTPFRSYLYAADLALWLWTILIRGKPMTAYNVGSDEDLTIEAVASIVANNCQGVVQIKSKAVAGAAVQQYVPDILRAKTELGLKVFTGLKAGIEKTIEWHRMQI